MQLAVVGSRGEKRLIKTAARPQQNQRGTATWGGRGWQTGPERPRPPPPATDGRERLPSRRRERSPEEEMETEGQPPEKCQTATH